MLHSIDCYNFSNETSSEVRYAHSTLKPRQHVVYNYARYAMHNIMSIGVSYGIKLHRVYEFIYTYVRRKCIALDGVHFNLKHSLEVQTQNVQMLP